MPDDSSNAPPRGEQAIEVPYEELAVETLRSLAEEFVTRDGTDYGATEKTLEEKVAGLMRQLETGKARIYFDSESGSVHIVATQELRKSGG